MASAQRAQPVEGHAFRSALHRQVRLIKRVAAPFFEGAEWPLDRELGSRSDGALAMQAKRLEFGKRRAVTLPGSVRLTSRSDSRGAGEGDGARLTSRKLSILKILNFLINNMSHTVKIYDTCIGCTQCVRACPTDVLEMIPWDGCKAGQMASAPRTEDCVGCKRCETACPTDFLSVRVTLGSETTRSMGLAY